ncbi:MAG: hypothetical protein LIR46_08125 [Bacteroidota bacterium]|nr:hypothetical protein [Bacteroidota bacterium]
MAEYITKDEALLQLTGINLPKDRDSYIALVTKRLQDVSTADVAPVIHAKWVQDYITADGHMTYHCSECGCYLKPKHSEPLNSFRWCSYCGAKMDKEEQE